ncbi:MAG: N-methylhydantoinase A [Alphaproteobacteria bacterium]|jgi:N-methylhydantoinase A
MVWYIGCDVGGTFTDFFAFDDSTGRSCVHKTPSTPDNPGAAILDGLRALCEAQDIAPDSIARLAHGTTVATNALIQRRGAPVGLITTKGFRDLLEIGRQIRPKLYDLKADYPEPLAPRHCRFEITERVGAEGQVLTALSDVEIDAIVDKVVASDVKAVAVCLLFAFINSDHEQRIGAALRAAAPDIEVSLSSDVQPEFREYERFSTTVLNAYLQPLLGRYMTYLKHELSDLAPNAKLGINQSSGGLMSSERARVYPIRTALSGPAAGVVGAGFIGRAAGREDVITLDMGGTSADVCLIRNGEAGVDFDQSVAEFPIRLPMVDVHTVGAGGGSIAWFDRDGLLKVGPASAGADPGPACYGAGGEDPTVSDANLVLGRLSEGGLLGGSMRLEKAAAVASLQPLAAKLGYSIERTAHGVLGIVVANMVRAIRAISIERGHDPRQFALMPLGGAGPLHAVDVARALGIGAIIVPAAPGILCAQGLIVSDLKEDFVVSARRVFDADAISALSDQIDVLVEEAGEWFASEGVEEDARRLDLVIDMRYVGQNFELPVAIDRVDGVGATLRLPEITRMKQLFFDAHEKSYGFFNPEDSVETVNIRLTARGRLNKPGAVEAEEGHTGEPVAPGARRKVFFDADDAKDTPVYDRSALRAGQEITGPAIIDQLDTTTILHPGDRARVDAQMNIIIEIAS